MKAVNEPTRCLVLACGNTLRSDDGLAINLAEWAEQRFQHDSSVRVIARQQWTPDLAEEIATADSVLFIDASVKSQPGRVHLIPISSRAEVTVPDSHHLTPSELLGLTRSLYGSIKSHAMLLTVGIGSSDVGESFSDAVSAALPRARGVLEKAVLRFLEN